MDDRDVTDLTALLHAAHARRRDPALIGVVHLLPTPGTVRYGGSMAAVLEAAEADAAALADGGADAVVVENFGDVPFRAERVDPETVAAMALAVDRVRARFGAGPVGVNCLRNDARSALGLCAATGAGFLRVNVHTGAAVTDQGLVQGRADETLRERARLGLDATLLVDVHVKHAVPLGGGGIEDAARDAVGRGLAEGLIVSGRATGDPVDERDLERVGQACPDVPLLIGSGLDLEGARRLAPRISGAVVATRLQVEGRIAAERVAAMREALRG
jgi:membrane complex biogenesis BtpA family protein